MGHFQKLVTYEVKRDGMGRAEFPARPETFLKVVIVPLFVGINNSSGRGRLCGTTWLSRWLEYSGFGGSLLYGLSHLFSHHYNPGPAGERTAMEIRPAATFKCIHELGIRFKNNTEHKISFEGEVPIRSPKR